MREADKERLKKIVEYWDKLSAEIESGNITGQMILTETRIQWTITTPLYNIGEQVYKLTPDLKKNYPDLPWSKVAGLRHRLVHEYEEINWEIISDILFHQMGDFVKSVEDILKTM